MPVYFVRQGLSGPIKIGYADDVQRRMIELQTSSPYPLKLLKSIEGDRKLERNLQTKFADFRLHGEWFKPNKPLLTFIKKLPTRRGRCFYKLKSLMAEKSYADGKRITYRDIAAEAKVSTNTLSQMAKQNMHQIGIVTLNKLCKYFNCQVGDIMIYRPEDEERPAKEAIQ